MFKSKKSSSKQNTEASKHKKLGDKTQDVSEVLKEREGLAFCCSYLGANPVDELSDESSSYGNGACAKAVKNIVTYSEKVGKPQEVSVFITKKGLVVLAKGTGEYLVRISIYRISFCCVDKKHRKVFAFVGRNKESETMECHAFLCPKKKVAKHLTMTVARLFALAKEEEDKRTESRFTGDIDLTPTADLDTSEQDDDSSSSPEPPPDVITADLLDLSIGEDPLAALLVLDVDGQGSDDDDDAAEGADDFACFARDRISSPRREKVVTAEVNSPPPPPLRAHELQQNTTADLDRMLQQNLLSL